MQNEPRYRRATDIGADPPVVRPEASRFYFRRALQRPADYPPVLGDVPAGGDVVPDPSQFPEPLEKAIQLARQLYPMRAARVAELRDRVRTAVATYRDVFREEEEKLQNHNEEARRADIRIDEQIREKQNQYRSELQRLEDAHSRDLEEWEATRKKIALLSARYGIQCDGDSDSDEDETDYQADADAATEPATPRTEADSARGISRLYERVMRPVRQVASGLRSRSGPAAPRGGTADAVSHAPASSQDSDAQRGAGEHTSSPVASGTGGMPAAPAADERADKGLGRAPTGEDAEHEGIHNPDVPEDGQVKRVRRRVYLSTEMPIAEAQARAPSIAAIASRHGLIWSPDSDDHVRRQALLHSAGKLASLVVFGAIFGFSVGILLGVLNVSILKIHWLQQWSAVAVCCLMGVFVFWAIGKAVTSLVQTVCEYVYGRLLASVEEGRHVSFRFYGLARLWAALAAIVLVAGLVAIEALVERYGIVEAFASAQRNRMLVSKGAFQGPHGPGDWEYIALSLIASVPFVTLYASTAWREAQARAVGAFLQNRREEEVHNLAVEIHRSRHQAWVALYGGEVFVEEPEVAAPPRPLHWEQAQRQEHARSTMPWADPSSAEQLPVPSGEHRSWEDRTPEASVLDASAGVQPRRSRDSGLQFDINAPGGDARVEATAAVRELIVHKKNLRLRLNRYYEERKALQREHAERLEALKRHRTDEITAMPEAALRRLHGAYSQCQEATRTFYAEYDKLARDVERKLADKGVWRRLGEIVHGTEENREHSLRRNGDVPGSG